MHFQNFQVVRGLHGIAQNFRGALRKSALQFQDFGAVFVQGQRVSYTHGEAWTETGLFEWIGLDAELVERQAVQDDEFVHTGVHVIHVRLQSTKLLALAAHVRKAVGNVDPRGATQAPTGADGHVNELKLVTTFEEFNDLSVDDGFRHGTRTGDMWIVAATMAAAIRIRANVQDKDLLV
jgi:hypothetical protein